MASTGISDFNALADFIDGHNPKLPISRKATAKLRAMHVIMPQIYDAMGGYRSDTTNYPDSTNMQVAMIAMTIAFSD